MSGGLFVQALVAETGSSLDATEVERLQDLHAQLYRDQLGSSHLFPEPASCW